MNQNHASSGSGIFATLGGILLPFNPMWAGIAFALGGLIHAVKPLLPASAQAKLDKIDG